MKSAYSAGIIIISVIIVIIGLLAWNYYELHHFQITEYIVQTTKEIGRDKTFLFLTDFHDSCYGKNNCRLLQAIAQQDCQAVLIGGDMINRNSTKHRERTIAMIQAIAEKYPVYYANGNHEYKMKIFSQTFGKQYEDYREALRKCGVHFLENESVKWDHIRLYGLEIENQYFDRVCRHSLHVEEIEQLIGKNDASEYTVLLAHNPKYMEAYVNWSPDLVLCGHFHGGIVRIPFLGAVISPQFDFFPKYQGGIYSGNNTKSIVSRGIGTHSIKIRLFNRPEIIKIKLQNKN